MVDVFGPHRLVLIRQHLDNSVQDPAWPAGPLSAGSALADLPIRPNISQLADHAAQPPL
jgi:hypothetical protein